MKINARILLISLSTVVLITVTTSAIYYSFTYSILRSKQESTMLNSASRFILNLEVALEQTEEDLNKISADLVSRNSIKIENTSIDFMFFLEGDSLINPHRFYKKKSVYLTQKLGSIQSYVRRNENIFLKFKELSNGEIVYYGRLITSDFLNQMSKNTNADVALILNGTPIETSNAGKNDIYLLSLIRSIRDLSNKGRFDLYFEEIGETDFLATHYVPKSFRGTDAEYSFLIFATSTDIANFRTMLGIIIIIVVVAGIFISLLFILFFTTRLRTQINILSRGAELTAGGNFDHFVEIITNDELGKLAEVFNHMLEKLKLQKQREEDYTELLSLINKNPELNKVIEASLKKIVKATYASAGIFHLVEEEKLHSPFCHGCDKDSSTFNNHSEYQNKALKNKKLLEVKINDDDLILTRGNSKIRITNLILLPIVYGKKPIALLELAFTTDTSPTIIDYLESIHDQLAIGIANARSLNQLEVIIEELKHLNEEYENQNRDIINKNEELILLHTQLKEKAEELEIQRAKAVEMTNIKSQFLASVSHELKTPLSSILGLTELMLKNTNTIGDNRDKLRVVLRSGNKLLGLINNILDFLKIESGKIEIRKSTFSMIEFLEDFKNLIDPLANEKDLPFLINYESKSDYLISTDKLKLEQILTNLISNAIKFTEHGSVILSVKVNNSDLFFSVKDSGIGISEIDRNIIFEEFRQADGGTSRKYSGTGLGLAISKRYAAMLGGNIDFESKVGKGSVFTLSLVECVLEEIFLSRDISFSAELLHSSDVHQNYIALLRPNKNTKELIEDYLSINNIPTKTFYSLTDFYASIDKGLPRAIILCVSNEDTEAWESLVKLKSENKTAGVPTIILFIDEGKKVGYAINVFGYLHESLIEHQIPTLVSAAGEFYDTKIKSILIADEQALLETRIENIKNSPIVKLKTTNPDKVSSELTKKKYDLIMLNLAGQDFSSIAIVDEIKRQSSNKNLPVVLLINNELSLDDFNRLNEDMQIITNKRKQHPLDVLKVIRDRLKIEYDSNFTKRLMQDDFAKEEIISQIFPTEENSKKKVLIVDDDKDTLFTVGEIVKELGYEVLFASTGVECLLTINNILPNLILLDIMMPKMDGFETIKNIKEDKRFQNVPVIALTAYAMLDNKEVIEKSGFTDIITKPIDTKILEEKVNALVKKGEKLL